MPIHNEEKLLPYSIPSVFRLAPDEAILILDRCFDKSLEIVERIAKRYKYRSRTKIIELNEPAPEWKNRQAFLRRYGFKLARNDIILNADADSLLDEKIADYLPLVGTNNVGMLKFLLVPFPRTYQSYIETIVSPFVPTVGYGGLYAFSKEAWLETEDQESLKSLVRAEDTNLRLAIQKKYEVIFVKTRTLHLRPRETREYHVAKGVTRWQVKRGNLFAAVIHSFIYLRPLVLAGYLKARLQTRERI